MKASSLVFYEDYFPPPFKLAAFIREGNLSQIFILRRENSEPNLHLSILSNLIGRIIIRTHKYPISLIKSLRPDYLAIPEQENNEEDLSLAKKLGASFAKRTIVIPDQVKIISNQEDKLVWVSISLVNNIPLIRWRKHAILTRNEEIRTDICFYCPPWQDERNRAIGVIGLFPQSWLDNLEDLTHRDLKIHQAAREIEKELFLLSEKTLDETEDPVAFSRINWIKLILQAIADYYRWYKKKKNPDFITASSFLFDDNYRINTGNGEMNLRELLDWIRKDHRDTDEETFYDMSVDKLREKIKERINGSKTTSSNNRSEMA